ncbi:hypothetical protein [Microbispora sp. NPDC049125]|uniref:hypothetical protein n=1 Tax=Microbispora sp. NPDC049125 TaxID=3154929 RepID=UPI00346623D6
MIGPVHAAAAGSIEVANRRAHVARTVVRGDLARLPARPGLRQPETPANGVTAMCS